MFTIPPTPLIHDVACRLPATAMITSSKPRAQRCCASEQMRQIMPPARAMMMLLPRARDKIDAVRAERAALRVPREFMHAF